MKTTSCLGLLTILWAASPGLAATQWDVCERNVFKHLSAKGIKDYKDPMAYIGQNAGGAEVAVVRVCGYKPMTEKACDTIFVKAYLSCRKGFYLSSVQQSWLFGHDPTTSDSSRL